jgi:large subunit ribosomal protein L6
MSRIGKMAVKIPAGVTVAVDEGNTVKVKGPKGELTQWVNPAISVAVDGGAVQVTHTPYSTVAP